MVIRTVRIVACDECDTTEHVSRWGLINHKGQHLSIDLCDTHAVPLADLFDKHYKGRGPSRKVYTEAELRKARQRATRKKPPK